MLEPSEVQQIQSAAYELIQSGDYQNATSLLDTLLDQDPNDATALNFMGYIALQNGRDSLAYQYFRRALAEKPGHHAIWANFGMAAHEMGRDTEAINAFVKSAEINPDYAKAYANAACVLVQHSDWEGAEKAASMALECDPSDRDAQMNMAHVYLAKHEWSKGWKAFDLALGCKFRKEWVYGNEKRWDGSKGRAVVVYGEQGLGDEIMYASVIPDLIADSKKVIIDCDPKLENLFKRSFPRADVHGTRREDSPEWLATARIDARCAIGSLPGFYRNQDADFPGTPYLKADPELRKMWRGLFDSWGKKVYGLTLSGGTKYTNESGRKIEPEQLSPLFANDAVFVSLDYKDLPNHPNIKLFPWATQASDYDLTAALIAELDAVIGTPTMAIHCANGLGVKTHVLVPEWHQWRYSGDFVWAKSCTTYHQGKGETWRNVVRRVEL